MTSKPDEKSRAVTLGGALVCCLAFVLTGCSQIGTSFVPVSKIAEEAQLDGLPDHRDYLDHGAVIILKHKVTRFDYEGYRLVRRRLVRSIVMYASEQGQEWLTPTIYLDDGDILESFSARTIKPDGQVIELDEDNLFPTQIAPRFVEFTTNRSMKFTFQGVEPGAIVEHTYSVKHADGFSSFSQWNIDHSIPCLCNKYTLQVPQNILGGQDLKWVMVVRNTTLPPHSKENLSADGVPRFHFEWIRKDLPAIKVEKFMPPMDEVRQYAAFGVMPNSWEEFGEWFWETTGQNFKANNKTKEFGADLNNECILKREKITNIFNHTQQNYRYVAVDMDDSGYVPNSPMDIIRRKYGDCKDVTVLNVSLLNGLGVEAYPALVRTWNRQEMDPDIAYPEFNHMVTYVPSRIGNEYWLDSTGGYSSLATINPAIAGVQALVIKPDGECFFKLIPKIDPELAAIDRFVHIDVGKHGQLSGHAKIRFSGLHSMLWRNRMKSVLADDLQDTILELLEINDLRIAVEEFRVDDLNEISDSLHVEFSWRSQNRGSNDQFCTVPCQFLRLQEPLPDFDSTKRINPIRLPYPIYIRDHIDVGWDSTSYKLTIPPTPMAFKESFGSLGCVMSKTGDKRIRREVRLYIDDNTIENTDFDKLDGFFDAVALLNEENLILTGE